MACSRKELDGIKYRYTAHLMNVIRPSLLPQWEGFPTLGVDQDVFRSGPSRGKLNVPCSMFSGFERQRDLREHTSIQEKNKNNKTQKKLSDLRLQFLSF